uniref:Ceramide synthase 4a n=1 Tax=Hucho hucho TaxID=62062 RepID=A0A4W5Q1U1_9TELE
MEGLLDQWLWKEEYWLPPGVTWKDIEIEGDRYPLPRDLFYTLPLALGFIVLRYVFERVIAMPLSRQLGVKDRVRVRALPVPKLETFYKQNKQQPSQSEVLCLGKHCGLSQRQIETWFRQRRNQDRPSNTKKFCEASNPHSDYLFCPSIPQTPWFWDHRECWQGYPKQPVAEAHYWYYITELGFYWSLLLCVTVDVKRKDFKEQIIHHIATILLIGFSYCANYVRVGTLVILVHDSSDFLLESAKMFNYAGWRKTCDTLFVIFALVFLLTRLVVFPGRIVHSTLVVSLDFFQPFFGYYFFNALLLVLQALHIFWAWLILRMVYKFVFMGKVKEEEETSWEQRKGALNSKLASLANNCVLNNLTNQRNMNSRLPKAR